MAPDASEVAYLRGVNHALKAHNVILVRKLREIEDDPSFKAGQEQYASGYAQGLRDGELFAYEEVHRMIREKQYGDTTEG